MLKSLRIGTKIGATFGIGLAVFAAIGVISYSGTRQLIETSNWVTHTYQVLGELENILSLLKDAETGQRGYLLTGETAYLDPYNRALANLDQKQKEARQLTADNPIQQQNFVRLKTLIDRRLEIFKRPIELRRNPGIQAAIEADDLSRGKAAMDEVRQLIAQMKAVEQALLEQRSTNARNAARYTLDSITFGIPLGFGLLTILGFLLNRHISRPLTRVSQTAEKIAGGDLSAQLPLLDRQDEVGILTRTFNQMVENLRDSLQGERSTNLVTVKLSRVYAFSSRENGT